MDTENLIELCKSTCDSLYDAKVRSYSGRGMHGKECVGLVSNDDGFQSVVAEMVRTGVDEDFDMEEVADVISSARTDSMGIGIVIYWPKNEWPTVEVEET